MQNSKIIREVRIVSDLNYELSSGNVYADLGNKDSAEMQIKAKAVRMLASFIADSGMTQNEVADVLGIDQPKISRILRGHFRGLSLEKIMGYIIALGNDIDITVHKKHDADTVGHFHIVAAS